MTVIPIKQKQARYPDIARKVQAIQADWNLSNIQLAHIMGTSDSAVSMLRNGVRMVTEEQAARLQQKLGINPDWLFDRASGPYLADRYKFIQLANIDTANPEQAWKDLKEYIQETQPNASSFLLSDTLMTAGLEKFNVFLTHLKAFQRGVRAYLTYGIDGLPSRIREDMLAFSTEKARVRRLFGINSTFSWQNFLAGQMKHNPSEPFSYAYEELISLMEIEALAGTRNFPGRPAICFACEKISVPAKDAKCRFCGEILL